MHIFINNLVIKQNDSTNNIFIKTILDNYGGENLD